MSKTNRSDPRTRAEPTWAKHFAKILRRLDRAWAAALRALTTLRLSDPYLSIIMGEGRMGLKIFRNGINLHTRRLPMAASSGLNGSQSATKPSVPKTATAIKQALMQHWIRRRHTVPLQP